MANQFVMLSQAMKLTRLLLLTITLLLLLSPSALAADKDGMPTWWEKRYKLNPNKNDGHRDADRDSLNNRREYRLRTNPRKADSDGDGMSDGFEIKFGFNPRRSDAREDKDGDGIANIDEGKVAEEPQQPQTMAAGKRGFFAVDCAQTARKNLDPIIAPGRPGVIHDHDFFGPKTVTDDATADDLINQPTSCGLASDRSAYWMPTLLNYGQPQEGGLLQAYYFNGEKTQPFPRGLKIIAGQPRLTISNPQSASWSCQPSSNYGQTTLPPCGQGGYILSEIRFPTCWNGRDLDSSDHRSHMAYFKEDGSCPQTHPVEVPELVLFRTFTQYAGLLDQASLSSGSTGGLHGDFVSGWDEGELSKLINRCRSQDCGRVNDQAPSAQLKVEKVKGLSKRFFCNLD